MSSLFSVVDFAVHFDTFRNVDLFHQGVYYHQVTAYIERNGTKVYAVPHSFFSSPSSKKSRARGIEVAGSDAFTTPAAIIDDEFAFRTRSFLIRYIEVRTPGRVSVCSPACDRNMQLCYPIAHAILPSG